MNNNEYYVADFFKGYSKGKGHPPEFWLKEYVVDKLPDNITTIIDFGCANGRNFIPFPNKYKYIGFDIFDFNDIVWMNDINVEYYRYSLENFYTNSSNFNIDWGNSLIMTHVTLMYLNNSEEQNNFINLLKSLGCKNFVLHEYGSQKVLADLSEHARNNKLGYLDLNENNRKMFESPLGNMFRFRDFNNDMCAFISLSM